MTDADTWSSSTSNSLLMHAYHYATRDYNVYFSASVTKKKNVSYCIFKTVTHALPKKSYTPPQPWLLTWNVVFQWFVYWSKYYIIHLATGFISAKNIPGVLLTPDILNAYQTNTPRSRLLACCWSASRHSQFLKIYQLPAASLDVERENRKCWCQVNTLKTFTLKMGGQLHAS